MRILFTVHCENCKIPNRWDITKTPTSVTLVFEGGYRVVCFLCNHPTVCRDLTQIKITQTR